MSDSENFITPETLAALAGASAPPETGTNQLEEHNRELEAYSRRLFRQLQVANEENKSLREKIEHLEELLAESVPIVKQIEVSTEQAIVEMQIEKLRVDAMERQLSLDETKRLDLLIKNLHAIKAKKAAIPITAKPATKYSEAQLVSIASPEPLPEPPKSTE